MSGYNGRIHLWEQFLGQETKVTEIGVSEMLAMEQTSTSMFAASVTATLLCTCLNGGDSQH